MSHRPRSPVQSESPITPAAFGVAPGSLFGALTANPDVRMANETLGSMKAQLEMLSGVFDSLGNKTTQMVNLGGEFETAQHLNRVRKEMEESDRKQQAEINEIEVLLENVLQREIVEHLRVIIEAGVLETIDEVVKEQVKAELPRVIPRSLQDEVAFHRKQLSEVQRALHNSESRRANSLLRTSKLTEDLHTIYKTDGTISPLFPKNLQTLFNMDAGSAAELLNDYDMLDATQSRERNLNRFMQFCGVTYQLVVNSKGTVPHKI